MPATRIVIDVQPTFPAANRPNLVVGVTRELMAAMKQKAHILVVEYRHCDPTHSALMAMLKDYPNYAKITKPGDDGGREVFKSLGKLGFPTKHLRVCGVNTDCCVQATVNTLAKLLPDSKFELVKNACEWSGSGKYDWRQFPRYANLKLV